MNPLQGVCLLHHWVPGTESTFLGSCFAFRHNTHFLTAAHCLGKFESLELGIMTPGHGVLKNVRSVLRHPSADLAIVETSGIQAAGDEVAPFTGIVSDWALGEDFFAYGYPADVLGLESQRPTPRLFKGHFQRFLRFESQIGSPFYSYVAGELSISCPAGLSGGPLFRPLESKFLGQRVAAIVTENLRSTTTLESLESVEASGKRTTIRHEQLIQYGVALMLSPVAKWIDEHIPGAVS